MVLCQQYFGSKFTLGRDRFCALLRRHGMMLRKRSVHPRTTNSWHRLYKYEDLLNTEPKFVPQRPGELLVADITYVAYQDGFAYLSLLTDAYSRCIVGYCLHPTLEVEGYLNALHQVSSISKKTILIFFALYFNFASIFSSFNLIFSIISLKIVLRNKVMLKSVDDCLGSIAHFQLG